MSDLARTAPADDAKVGPFDLAVIGAGSAGFSAAIAGADLGAHVALIGHGALGGTCVNVGCVPSKTLIRAVEVRHQADAAARFAGVRACAEIEDWRAVIAQKDELIGRLRQAKYADILPTYNSIAYLEGSARFVEDGVGVNGRVIRARSIIVATGARPAVPDLPGLRDVPFLSSTTAMELERLPRSMLIVGAGYVGCELAQMFARAGVEVTLVCRSRVLPRAEPEISEALTGFLRDEGLKVRCGNTYTGIARTSRGVALLLSTKGSVERLEAEAILVATGRQPNTEGLGLRDAGVQLNEAGWITVDDRMRTSRAGVYAAGDVTGRDQFVYMAAHGAKIAAENALNSDGRQYDATAVPSVVFTDPQVASVGLTEAAARDLGISVLTSTLPLAHLPRALAARDTRGLIKLVAETGSGRLLGAHVLAPEGADSIQTAALAIRQGLTASDLADTIFPYLTTVEGLKLAAQGFQRNIARLSCCAG